MKKEMIIGITVTLFVFILGSSGAILFVDNEEKKKELSTPQRYMIIYMNGDKEPVMCNEKPNWYSTASGCFFVNDRYICGVREIKLIKKHK